MEKLIYGIAIILLNISLYPQSELLLLMGDDERNTTSFTVTASTNSFVFASGSNFQVAGTTGKILSIDWGDGTTTNLTFIAPNTMQSITKTYANAGTYNVKITGWKEVRQLSMSNLTGLTYNLNNNPLPSGLTYLYLYNLGTSITGGTLNNFVAVNANTLYFSLSGNAVDITTGLTRAWNNCNITITPQTGYGYTTAQIDSFLINYDAVAGTGSKTIDLRGANQPRSSASDAAVSSLISKGRTILTNP